jgi:hypothetical protein
MYRSLFEPLFHQTSAIHSSDRSTNKYYSQSGSTFLKAGRAVIEIVARIMIRLKIKSNQILMIWDDAVFLVRWIISKNFSSGKWSDRQEQSNLWNWHKSNRWQECLEEFINPVKAGSSRLVIHWRTALNMKTTRQQSISGKRHWNSNLLKTVNLQNHVVFLTCKRFLIKSTFHQDVWTGLFSYYQNNIDFFLRWVGWAE